MITRTFKLCLTAGTGSAPYINVNQYDRGETWLFELYNEDGTRYTPSSGAIIGLKADGHAIANDGTVDSEGRVVIAETEQMTAAAGRSVFELSIDSNTHGTANFIVKAERKPTDDAEYSDSDLSMFQTVIDASEVINEVIGEGGDPSQRITDAVEDWLEAHPEATTTVEDGAITAPKINQSLWDKLLVSEEASGSVASFSDGADGVPVKSLKVSIDPVQSGSGDPSPTNVRPISGHTSATVTRTGFNQWDEQWEVGYYGSTGQPSDTSGYIRSKNYIPVTPNATYYCHTGTASNFCLQFYGRDKAFISQSYNYRDTTVTIPSNVYYVLFWRNENAYNNDISINYPSTITDYHAYTGNTYPYSLGQTVYGGTVDLATGVLTVTNGIVTDFSALASNGTSSTGAYRYKLAVAGVAGFTIGEAKCNMLKFKAGFNDDAGEFCNATDVFNIFLVDSTVASAITTLTGCQIVYPLATPQTIQLTPTQVRTLLGYNNISSSGTVDVIYHADTKLYVDKMTNVDNSVIAPTEADFVATRNYTTNDLVIVNDTLYKVTANIATGSTITPNSNVTQTTLSALIKALS